MVNLKSQQMLILMIQMMYFNSIIMANEKVTIDNGVSITSNVGKGLVQGSLANTVDNSKTAYINNGTVNISGANSNSIALRVNHGTIENNNLVKMTDGIGLYGSSGSKLHNKSNGTIQITSASAYGVGYGWFPFRNYCSKLWYR